MLTLQQAYEVKASIIEYLKATFNFKEREVNNAFIEFIEEMFKGPYISLKLPFIKADDNVNIPLEIKPNFAPFIHQLQAFKRLTTEKNNPQPTILTTGTGSGKTEAFLYPLLDYCYKQRDIKGIKVIILYPMNALATDQANRLAKTIYNDEKTRGKIRAGLFIGESQAKDKKYPREMGKENIIESRDEILQAPPDILLTNFKMLDFALMQNRFYNLWFDNYKNPEQLKFIVLDELHTYEGAQGSDVANLIRRLKLKLEIPIDHLCPVGTSATIGKGEESKKLLADFGSKIFGEDFTEDSIIEEHRISIDEFFIKSEQRNFIPTTYLLNSNRLKAGEDFITYIKKQLNVWDINPNITKIKLSEELKNYTIIKDLVEVCSITIQKTDDLIKILNRTNKEFATLPNWIDAEQYSPKEEVIRSILSLISYASTGDDKQEFPFLYLQVQLWIRELSGFVRVIEDAPLFKWREDISTSISEKALPIYFCRECGASGWLGVKNESADKFNNDINDVYQKYFGHHKNLYLITEDKPENEGIDEYEPTDIIRTNLNIYTLTISNRPNENTIKIIAYRKLNGNYNLHICPHCNTKNTINLVGQRVSTLSSISTSQLLASDLDSSTEKDRKLLAFSNGVQDAAHLAGFLEARNYRFSFRTALQNTINRVGKPINLVDLQKEFIEYWSNNADESGKNNLLAYFYKFFPNDHTADVDIEKRYKRNPTEFINEFNHRVTWEIASEFGYNSIIGRTLEKTGSSVPFFQSDIYEQCFDLIKVWLNENALENITKDEFVKFFFVFLNRLRTRGGVDHIYLNKFRTRKSSPWQITQSANPQHFLIRNFGKNTRLPKFITDQSNSYGVFDLTTRSTTTNWFHTYFKKSFPLAQDNADLVNEFFQELLKILSSSELKILNAKDAQGIRNFAIEPEQLFIKNEVKIFECNICGNRISTTKENSDFVNKAKCSVYRCIGEYDEIESGEKENYYKKVYNRGRAPRVYAADHTGLLDRLDRENKEIDFKIRPNFNSLNTLVATSTLEMGIDIGTLNSAINSSIPPLPSNFLQRVGRAGRSSGSAIVINFVHNEGHDLYYFNEPIEMMDGEINTPGCYLEAKEILRRHFLAYCTDSWTKENPEDNFIPSIIRVIKLETLDVNSSDFFVAKLISFIKINEKRLFESFKNSFREKVSDEIFDELKLSLKSNQLFESLKRTFLDLKDEVIMLKQKQKEINEYAKVNNLDPSDPEYLELMKEYRNLSSAILLIRKRQTVEHLTNVGLLPNYAFPETGVTLKASVSRKREDDPTKYDVKPLEVVRSAKSAIREFAPENLFYTQGYKLKISGVNITSWKEEVIDFRFCSVCDNIKQDLPPIEDHCPKCGSETWRSSRNTHKVIRMKNVNSFTDEKSAKLDDTSEERAIQISHITKHFTFNNNSMQGSWVMKKIPFGIEYIKDVMIHEMNAGLNDSNFQNHNNVVINGDEVPQMGYLVCKSCGKSTSDLMKIDRSRRVRKEARDLHFGFCKSKNQNYIEGISDSVFEEVYFYRTMKTEAIKILIPVQEFNTESGIKLFKAGIQFGLRKYYRGNPGHLLIIEYSEFNQQTKKNDRYLVLYDNIPGGTGYLSKLFDVDEFNEIVKLAYENIRGCKCKENGKDGCYNCIYTYGNQFEREELSRARAEELFSKIYKARGKWDYSPGGLGKITNTGQIEESELEERFIQVIQNYFSNKERTNSKFTLVTEDGITKYNFSIDIDEKNSITYEIRPQVTLGPSDGVKFSTVADFMITCISAKINDVIIENPFDKFKQIAIYLDGYQYHASKENNRFIKDVEKRLSILDSNKYYIWIFTWADLDLFYDELINKTKNKSDYLNEVLRHETSAHEIQNHPLIGNNEILLKDKINNLERFIWLLNNYLTDSYTEQFKKYHFLFQSNFPNNCIEDKGVKNYSLDKTLRFEDLDKIRQPESWCYIDLPQQNDISHFRIFQKLITLEFSGSVFLKSELEYYEKELWSIFWLRFNLIQFFQDRISFRYFEKKVATVEKDKDDLSDLLENFDAKYHELITQLVNMKIELSRDDYFNIKDKDDRIIAESFIGLPQNKIVIDPLNESSREVFVKNGYTVYTLDEFKIKDIK